MDTPHLNFPLRFENYTDSSGAIKTRMQYVDQDTPEEVLSCVRNIANCPIGARLDKPDFGIHWPAFRSAPLDVSDIQAQLQEQEPRADVELEEYGDVANETWRHINVNADTHQS